MNPLAILQHRHQQFQAALEHVLLQWHRRDFDANNVRCWACQSANIKTSPRRLGRKTYHCCNCNTLFYEPLDPHCDCPEPGKSSKCSQCLSYQQLMQMVTEHLKSQAERDSKTL